MRKQKLFIIVLIVTAVFSFFSCEMDSTEQRQDKGNQENMTTRSSKISEIRLYKGLNCTGTYFSIYMSVSNGKCSLSNSANIDLNKFPSSWNDKVRSIKLISRGCYPSLYVFKDPYTPGGNDKVMKISNYKTNISSSFGISSVLPIVPESYRVKRYVKIKMFDGNVANKYLSVRQQYGDHWFPVMPYSSSTGVQEMFQITFVDVNQKFFSLKSMWNGLYLCNDLNKDPNRKIASLYARSYNVDYWELFRVKIYHSKYYIGTTGYGKFHAVVTAVSSTVLKTKNGEIVDETVTGKLWSNGTNKPITTINDDSDASSGSSCQWIVYDWYKSY